MRLLMGRENVEVSWEFRPIRARRLGVWCGGGEVGKPSADAVDHGEDQLFNLLGLNFGLGEELGGAEAEFRHFCLRDLTAGVDDQGKGAQVGLLTEPFDEREAVAVGQGQIEDEKVRWACDALPNGLLTRGSVSGVGG